MIHGLGLTEYFSRNKIPYKKKIAYRLLEATPMKGPLRSMQKFVVILMTGIGSDPLHPWFGTKLSRMNRMNMTNTNELTYFIKEQCMSGINQFFNLQAQEAKQNSQTNLDVINTIELTKIEVNKQTRNINITFRIKPLKSEAIEYTLEIDRE